MMTDFIDLLYQIESVEGIALLSKEGDLIDNQLSVVDQVVLTLSQTAFSIREQLAAAQRLSRGFLVRIREQVYLLVFHADYLVVIEVAHGASCNEISTRVTSLLGSAVKTPPASLAQPAAVAQQEPSSPNGYDLTEVKAALLVLLTRVSPAHVAQRILSQEESTLPSGGSHLNPEEALAWGTRCLEKIPNKKRREIITQEYQETLKSLSFHSS